MATRLSDKELAARVRSGNQRRAQRLYERRRAAGLVSTTIWLDSGTKEALDKLAANRGESIAATIKDLLERAIADTPPATARKAR